MAGIQSGEGRTMIDSVVWAQYINVTNRHILTATAAPTHCIQAAETRENIKQKS